MVRITPRQPPAMRDRHVRPGARVRVARPRPFAVCRVARQHIGTVRRALHVFRDIIAPGSQIYPALLMARAQTRATVRTSTRMNTAKQHAKQFPPDFIGLTARPRRNAPAQHIAPAV